MKLTKTDLLIYQNCPYNACVKIHEQDVFHAKPLSMFDQLIREYGYDVLIAIDVIIITTGINEWNVTIAVVTADDLIFNEASTHT